MRLPEHRRGFTLIELLISMAMILTLLSAVYGSYVAVAQSGERYQERMTATHAASRTLQRISTLIRGVCPPIPVTDPNTTQKAKTQPMFVGDNHAPDGRLMEWVTTMAPNAEESDPSYTRVALHWDRIGRGLELRWQPFVPGMRPPHDKSHREVLCEDVDSIDVTFYDGRQTFTAWNSQEKKALPPSIRIRLAIHQRTDKTRVYTIDTRPISQTQHLRPPHEGS